jgi:hypothetical protein
MITHRFSRTACLGPASVLLLAAATAQASWAFRPSYFTHDPNDDQRVAQYVAKKQPMKRVDPTYVQSGYRHNRMSIRVGNSADRLHMVETWGQGDRIRPYGEWQRPFREGATPYGPWGNPQGPWTTPYGSWVNPYGLGQLPHPPWPHWGVPPGAGPPSPHGHYSPAPPPPKPAPKP